MAGGDEVFLSYSRNDEQAAALLRAHLERAGLSVFKDNKSIREGDLWLDRLQQAVERMRLINGWPPGDVSLVRLW